MKNNTKDTSLTTGWHQISHFGVNPGQLNMYTWIPRSMPSTAAPLVLVLHGCGQTAASFASETGWNQLASKYKFYVIHAEQQKQNNQSGCFNWFNKEDISRGSGEVHSLFQMVAYMQDHYPIEKQQIHVTGLSAGGAMACAVLACYPEVFASGAIMAGLPYGAANSMPDAFAAMQGRVNRNAEQWAAAVITQNPGFVGTYPRVAVFQGSMDKTVVPSNALDIVKQWAYLHKISGVPAVVTRSFGGHQHVTHHQYNAATGNRVVELFEIEGMGHGISVAPGNGAQPGGKQGKHAFNTGFYSSYEAARFFGISMEAAAVDEDWKGQETADTVFEEPTQEPFQAQDFTQYFNQGDAGKWDLGAMMESLASLKGAKINNANIPNVDQLMAQMGIGNQLSALIQLQVKVNPLERKVLLTASTAPLLEGKLEIVDAKGQSVYKRSIKGKFVDEIASNTIGIGAFKALLICKNTEKAESFVLLA